MARPTNRPQRRREIAQAFERALATHGLGGATIALIAAEADCAPGLVHHHFRDREDLVCELIRSLVARFRSVLPADADPTSNLEAYIDGALGLPPQGRATAAPAWVGLFAEAIRSQVVATQLRQALREELGALERSFRALGLESDAARRKAAGTLATVIGALVFGALMPGESSGFAAPFLKELLFASAGGDQHDSGEETGVG